MKVRKHHKITDEIMDEIYRHVPLKVLARMKVDHRGVTRLESADAA